jgi:hypothetical protein
MEVVIITPGSETDALLKENQQIKNIYSKVIGRTGDTFVHSHFDLLHTVTRCFEKIKMPADLEKGIRKREIPAYKKLKTNTETIIKTLVMMFTCSRGSAGGTIFDTWNSIL